MSRLHLLFALTFCGLAMLAGGCAGVAAGDGSIENPVHIPHVAGIDVDADGADWAAVPRMPTPFQADADSTVRLAWNETGLYGWVDVTDPNLQLHDGTPWTGDCFELFVDKAYVREDVEADTGKWSQYVFAVSSAGGCVMLAPDGHGHFLGTKGLSAACARTDAGYAIELRLAPEAMAPAKLAAGEKIGLNFAIDDSGEPVLQFFSDKETDEAHRRPSTWGTAVLAD